MRVIGVLGGMSSASTALYYSRLNAAARARMGGLHGASLLIRSVDFAPIAALQEAGEWERAGAALNAEARALERGGAELLLLATNTMHCVADRIVHGMRIPFLHIGDATASAIARDGHRRPGLMATAFTMEGTFYTDKLRAAGLEPVIPSAEDRALTHRIIYDELCKDVVTTESRAAFEQIAERLVCRGADSLILGCTEVGMLLNESNVSCPVYDTTHVHCDDAIAMAVDSATTQTVSSDHTILNETAASRLRELGGSVSAKWVSGSDFESIFQVVAHIGEQRLAIRTRAVSCSSAEQKAAAQLLASLFADEY